VASVLVLLSIALITVYFRESSGGGLHQVQSAGATVLRPFEIGANRVAQPFRDAYGYFAGLVNAKSENNRLRAELDQLRQQEAQNLSASSDNASLQRLLNFVRSPSFPAGYAYVGANIIVRSPSDFEQQVTINAGTANGIRVYDPVVTGDGLLGTITKAETTVSQLTLLTDDTSAVSAVDAQTLAPGVVRQGAAGMSFDRVSKDQLVNRGDTLITSGWKLGGLTSIYPHGIPIGHVTYVGQNEVDFFKHVQLQPFANFKSVSSVLVLIPKHR
jgi:rod shape-determining protein MreC